MSPVPARPLTGVDGDDPHHTPIRFDRFDGEHAELEL
jgi:hypothetical protein